VDVISRYVTVRKTGKNYSGLCPFHNDTKPSFVINPEKQFYKCYGCGKGGDVISFVMEQEGVTFTEAVRELAQRYGINFRSEAQSNEVSELRRVLDWAKGFFVRQYKSKPTGTRAVEYVKKRGFEDRIVEEAEIGYAPDSWQSLYDAARRDGLTQQMLVTAGLVVVREDGRVYDRFRNRLMFPIFDLQGRVVGFGGRALGEEEPKYLNTQETPLFHKGRVLYGLNLARPSIYKEGRAVVVEGYTDVLMARQYGIENFCATLGTALTKDNAWQLRKLVESVTVLFDSDAAGEKASERGLEVLLEVDLDVKVATLEAGLDPCDYLLKHGAEAMNERLQKTEGLVAFLLHSAAGRGLLNDASSKARVLDKVLTLVSVMPNPIKRDLVLREIAATAQVAESSVRSRFSSLEAGKRRPVEPAPAPPAGLPTVEEDVLSIALRNSGLLPRCRELCREFGLEMLGPVLDAAERVVRADGTIDISDLLGQLTDPALQALAIKCHDRDVLQPEAALDVLRSRFEQSRARAELRKVKQEAPSAQSEAELREKLERIKQITPRANPRRIFLG